MSTQGDNSVIHRKANRAREDFDARAMSPAKALRLSLAKAADRLFDLALTVSTVEQLTLSHGGLQGEAGEDGLLILLDGQGGARGAVRMDFAFLAALIEVQTTGTVRAGAVEPRPVTRTDAAMCAPLIDAMLKGYDTQLTEEDAAREATEFRFGDRIEDGRALSLALEAPDYDLFRITVDIEQGAKAGQMSVILPHRPVQVAGSGAAADADLAFALEENAMNAPVTLDAVLARVRLPLRELCDWQVGTLLPVGAEAVRNTEITASKGHVVARAQLGQMNGFRAVRIRLPAGEGEDEDAPGMAPDSAAWADAGLPAGDPGADDGPAQSPGDVAPLAGLDDLPGLGEDGGAGGLPSLPMADGPDLPELQELSDLPDLPGLNEEEPAEGA